MPFTIIRQDITKMNVDAIVNAANTELLMGGGVCGAIFKQAGAATLQSECNKLSPIKTGQAVITKGFALPADFIIHVAGPRYCDGKSNEENLLRQAYSNSLELAKENECKSMAFPLISSGIYGYPKAEALQVATEVISQFLMENEMEIFLTVFDKSSFDISKDLIGEIDSFIDENYTEDFETCQEFRISHELEIFHKEESKLDEPFSETLLRLIDTKGKNDVEVYKRANIDRKLFSKIRTGKGYTPSKKTAIALAISLELTVNETQELLGRAGYTLSKSQKFDVIIEYFITHKKYNIFEINEVLFHYDQSLLGGQG